MNHRSIRCMASLLMGMGAITHGMELQLKTSDGLVKPPQEVINASPILKKIQSEKNTYAAETLCSTMPSAIVEGVIQDQQGISSPSESLDRKSRRWIGDLPEYIKCAATLEFRALHEKYGRYAQDLRN